MRCPNTILSIAKVHKLTFRYYQTHIFRNHISEVKYIKYIILQIAFSSTLRNLNDGSLSRVQ